MAEIMNILRRLEKVFAEVTINYVIVGGIAAIIKGRARTTTDVDIILEDDEEKISKFLHKLKENGFDVLEEQVKWAFEEGTNASIFDTESFIRLDIKIGKRKIDIDALRTAKNEFFNKITLKVASVEFILLGKIWFLGDISNIPSEELLQYNDVVDFLTVYKKNNSILDTKWLKNELEKMGMIKTYDLLLDLYSTTLDKYIE